MALRRRFVGATLALLGRGGVADAQPVFDHMKCYVIRDSLRSDQYTADLVPKDTDTFATEPGDTIVGGFVQRGCRIKIPAKFYCIDISKQNPRQVNPPHDPGQWTVPGSESGDRLCYKLKCPNVQGKTLRVVDQFGTRDITLKTRVNWLCTPATRPAPANEPCSIGGDGQCGGTCPAGEVCLATSGEDCGCVPPSMACPQVAACGTGMCGGVWETCISLAIGGCGCNHS